MFYEFICPAYIGLRCSLFIVFVLIFCFSSVATAVCDSFPDNIFPRSLHLIGSNDLSATFFDIGFQILNRKHMRNRLAKLFLMKEYSLDCGHLGLLQLAAI